jgi:thioredoxin reductase (NADPH)
VVGGGDSALQEALTLAETAERVIVLHRGEDLDAQASYRRRVADDPAIEVRYGVTVEEIVGSERVEAVRVREPASDAVEELAVAAVFPFVGLEPNSEPFADHAELDERRALRADGGLVTSAGGLFAAGVVRSGAAGRAAAASGEGAAAAIAADAYLG